MDPDWEKAAAIIAAEEAFVDYPYDDCDPHYPHPRWAGGELLGTATIGYGETDPEIVGGYVSRGDCMTEDDASALLRRRLPAYWEAAKADLTVDLDPNQAAAVLSMAYNAGPAGMRLYAPGLLAAINERRFTDAVEIWRTSIVRANGVVLPGLQRRRANEATLFGTPWQADPPSPAPDQHAPSPEVKEPPGAEVEEPPEAEAPAPPEGEGKEEWSPESALTDVTQAVVAGVRAAIRASDPPHPASEGVGPAHGQADGSPAPP